MAIPVFRLACTSSWGRARRGTTSAATRRSSRSFPAEAASEQLLGRILNPPDFSLAALYEALDDVRNARGISWAAVTREINARFCDVPGHRAIAASTISGLRDKDMVEGDGVLQMLVWLRRSPESFVPGF